jgi:hypothetical protein
MCTLAAGFTKYNTLLKFTKLLLVFALKQMSRNFFKALHTLIKKLQNNLIKFLWASIRWYI